MEKITSRQNEKIRDTAFLKKRSERENTKMFFFEGVHLLEEYLRFGHKPVYVFATSSCLNANKPLLEAVWDKVYEVADSVYEKITEERSPQGVLCVSPFLDNIKIGRIDGGSVILESLQDTGNVGTVIRTAASLGACKIALTKDCADIYAPKTVRATMGALFSEKITVTEDIEGDIKRLRSNGGRVFATLLDENAKKLGGFDIHPTDSFVIGNEGNGISKSVRGCCDGGVYIPMSGRTESLNAAVAASIVMWEMKRNANK